jgi:6-pyruvoyltetrahydropterin/6-carboxytetrahydropterin synthase
VTYEVLVTKRFEFSAAHRLWLDNRTPEENRRLYGRCASPHGDGHNFLLDVTVGGRVDRTTGMVLDIGELKRIVIAEVLDRFDHKHLNLDTEEFRHRAPTSEHLAIVIWERLERVLPPVCRLVRVRVAHDASTVIEYEGVRA